MRYIKKQNQRQIYVQEKVEDTKWRIRSCKSNGKQHNGPKKTDKRTINSSQTTTKKTSRTSLKTRGKLRWFGKVTRVTVTHFTSH